MANKTTKKGKKPLQTTLGKACINEKEVDLSHVRRPIDTSIFGLKHVLTLFQTATEEVKNYITYECDIMYECRICKTIYRSLANFILHKRNYCREKFIPSVSISGSCGIQDYAHPPRSPEGANIIESRTLVTPDPNDTGGQAAKKGLSPVIEKLKEKQEINRLTSEILSKDLSKEESNGAMPAPVSNSNMLLEKIATNNAAVFQTMLQSLSGEDLKKSEFMRSEVMEIHGILDSDEAVLGADGKICNFQTNRINSSPVIPKTELVCTECDMKFSTRKTLVCHLRNKHNNTRLVYLCPDCKEAYANAWGVYRHLYKVHRKTSAQVKRLRQQVHNSIIRKDEEPHKKGEKKGAEKLDKTDEENQWLNNIEGDNDFQMCGGCGKRFERKAALHSHAQMCTKRIAVCNTIKENNAKKKEEESKDVKAKPAAAKLDKPLCVEEPPLKGASKRKPYQLRTYKTVGEAAMPLPTENNCDVNANTEKSATVCAKETTDESPESRVDASGKNQDGARPEASVVGSKGVAEVVKRESLVATPESPAHPTEDFDSFCQRVADRIRQTVNLGVQSQANNVPVERAIEDAVVKNEEVEDEESRRNVSPCRISIRSLEDLIGFPKEGEEAAAAPKAKSPKSRKSPRRSAAKRKRTASLDSARSAKAFKRCDLDSLFDRQDVSFTTKAAPFMDAARLECKPCAAQFPTTSLLLRHMSRHFSWFRFQCGRCSFIAFSKSECTEHAGAVHGAARADIASFVLPIPNWKTVLMANEFREIDDERDDSAICGREDGAAAPEAATDNIIDTLFVDSESSADLEPAASFPMPIVDDLSRIKNESIDIVDVYKDSFQVEVPQEFEVVSIDDSDEDGGRFDFRAAVKSEAVILIDLDSEDRSSDDIFKEETVAPVAAPDEQTEAARAADRPEPNEVSEEAAPVSLRAADRDGTSGGHSRPTRNRVRSIKTLQDDFFYDLGRAMKVNDSAATHKQKKTGGGAGVVRKDKGMRVYSNRQ